MISIKIEGIFEPEQVRIQKSIDKEDFVRKGLFRADSYIEALMDIIKFRPGATNPEANGRYR
ncbi:MAG: hypothetical protein JJU02_00660 [Cryomorphaceae bacterium]|nr:hypothetical protein [Cryomorphaceae bacterium]